MLASNIPVVGDLDPKRASAGAAPAVSSVQSDFTAEELNAMISAGGGTAETTGSAAKKGGKRRKA